MSFDIYACSFRHGERFPIDEVAARAVMQNYGVRAHGDTYSGILLPGGGEIETYNRWFRGEDTGPFESEIFMFRGFGEAHAEFLFRFCGAAGMVMIPCTNIGRVVATSEEQLPHLPDMGDFDIVVARDAHTLLCAMILEPADWLREFGPFTRPRLRERNT
jgi:hypothetical protein